jgi:hypothetical protein
MRIIDAIRYGLKISFTKKIKTIITIIIFAFLNTIMLTLSNIGINAYDNVSYNYLNGLNTNGYQLIVEGINGQNTSKSTYDNICEILNNNKSNVSQVYMENQDIIFYDFNYSSIKNPLINKNDIILTKDYMDDYSVGDNIEINMLAYNSGINVSFNVLSFSDDYELPVADLNYVLDYISLDKFYIEGLNDKSYLKSDLKKTYEMYKDIKDINSMKVQCGFFETYAKNKLHGKIIMYILFIITFLLMLSTIGVVFNIIIVNFNSNKTFYAEMIIVGAKKNNIIFLFMLDIFINIFLSSLIGLLIGYAFINMGSDMTSTFIEYLIGNDLGYVGLQSISIKYKVYLIIPAILLFIYFTIAMILSMLKITDIYNDDKSLLLKEIKA